MDNRNTLYALEAAGLQAGYAEKLIIENLDLAVPAGMVTVIIGPNGCGKSTLLKSIGRILKPQSGSVLLEGEDLFRMPSREAARKLAILPQSPKAPQGMTIFDLVKYGRFPYRKGIGVKINPDDEKIINWALDATQLSEIAGSGLESLSGGQRQRAWIAMALAQQTQVILLDEPTTYLDISYQLEIMELLSRLNKERGYTIIMVLHDLNLASRFADYMIAMREGKIVVSGTPDQVITRQMLRDVFNIDAEIIKDKYTGKPCFAAYRLLRNEDQ
ncbi:MAG: ABC transporter ATP-binding protein [Solobacterium sp.]|nr:ABC transporter ATP-binding protein [Solobacterium sp.]